MASPDDVCATQILLFPLVTRPTMLVEASAMNQPKTSSGSSIGILLLAIAGLAFGIWSLVERIPLWSILGIACSLVSLIVVLRSSASPWVIRVAIIGLLIGGTSLTTQILSARYKSLKVQAMSDIDVIQHAIREYFNEYSELPNGESSADIIAVLLRNNPRKILFLDVPESSFVNGNYVDPWGSGYSITLDLDYDDVVIVGNHSVSGKCAVWSFGKNRQDEKGAGDDVFHWQIVYDGRP